MEKLKAVNIIKMENWYTYDTESENFNFFDLEKKARLILYYYEDIHTYVLLIDDKNSFRFFSLSLMTNLSILDENIANIPHNFETFKFKIELNEDDSLKSYYLYSEIFEDLDLVIYHGNRLRSFYSYQVKKESSKYKYKLVRVNFYVTNERILQLYFDDDDFSNYEEIRYLKAGDKNYRYTRKNIYSDKWICRDVELNKEVNASACLEFDQSYYNEIMNSYFYSYDLPLIPDNIFEEFGFNLTFQLNRHCTFCF